MNVGDVVIPRDPRNVLACGSGIYTHAICASIKPFVLISEHGDMRWSATIEIDEYLPLCQADRKIRKIVAKRLKRDIKVFGEEL